MQRADFVKMMDDNYAAITEINRTKGHDYAGDDDALANFKQAGEKLGLTPEQVWGVYADKHWSAVMTFIKEGDVKSEPIEGRLHDVILYSFLLLGLIAEKKHTHTITISPADPDSHPGYIFGVPPGPVDPPRPAHHKPVA